MVHEVCAERPDDTFANANVEPIVGWPAIGNSRRGVKMRIRTDDQAAIDASVRPGPRGRPRHTRDFLVTYGQVTT